MPREWTTNIKSASELFTLTVLRITTRTNRRFGQSKLTSGLVQAHNPAASPHLSVIVREADH